MRPLDKKDRAILNLIADNARLPYVEIGKQLKISKDSVRARIDHLIK